MDLNTTSYRVLFDQYSRYRAAAEILHRTSREQKVATLLDVGSGTGCLLGQFLPSCDITFVDPLLAGSSEDNKIGETVFSSRLDGATFDHLVCLDTLEHVLPEDRRGFLERLSTLARTSLVLGGPFLDAGDAEATDRWIGDTYRAFAGHDYQWLEEHQHCGLPSLAETRSRLEELGWHCETVGNGHTPWMRELLASTLCFLEIPLLRDVALDLSEEFNRTLYPFDSLPPVYRHLILARKGERPEPSLASRPEPDVAEAGTHWDSFKQRLVVEPLIAVGRLPALSEAERDALAGELPKVPQVSALASRTSLIEAVQGLADSLEAERSNCLQLLAERDGQERLLRQEHSDRIELLEKDIEQLRTDRDRRLAHRDVAINALRQDLAAIHSSTLWRVAHGYWSARRFLGSLRRSGPRRLLRYLRRGRDRAAVAARRPAAEELPAVESSRYDVIVFPIIEWSFRFQRPQQLSRQFAAHGHRVFFVRPEFLVGAKGAKWREIENRVFELWLPANSHLNVYQQTIDPQSKESMVEALEGFRALSGDHPTVCLVELPFWSPIAEEARKRWGWRLVYDCMDEHSGFSTNRGVMLRDEEQLLRESDLVVATSRALYDKAAHSRARLLLPNATDFDHFHRAMRLVPHDAGDGRPVIGYYGAISDWFDVDLVERAARAHPDWRFRLVGSTFGSDVSSLARLENVELPGEVSYDVLPSILASFDVALIPFQKTPLTLATNPVKFYEYLSAGKPVVAVSLPELDRYSDYYYAVDRAEDFVSQIERALAEGDLDRQQARIDLARRETWAARYRSLDAAVTRTFGRAAVVVVSYGNIEYLRLCLESIRDRTLYPSYRVVVVDNASPSEVREFLKASEGEDDRLQVILNAENVGFAKANNIGIQAAEECEYVVLLNDDTTVTGGWLNRLLRHLDQDPGIGLVGPVTNSIGNEAMIEVPYESLEDLEPFAVERARSHLGRSFEIPMLAMYCVAMRRSLLEEVGLLDERFRVGMFEDDDFSRRVHEAGLRTVCAEDVFIHHWGRSSFKRLHEKEYRRLFEENRRRYEEKWGEPWLPHRRREGMPPHHRPVDGSTR